MKITGIIFLLCIALFGVMGLVLNSPFVGIANQRTMLMIFGIVAVIAMLILIAIQPKE